MTEKRLTSAGLTAALSHDRIAHADSDLLGTLSQRFVPFVLVLETNGISIRGRGTKDDDEDDKNSTRIRAWLFPQCTGICGRFKLGHQDSDLLGTLSQRFVPFVLVLRPSSSSSKPTAFQYEDEKIRRTHSASPRHLLNRLRVRETA